MKIRKILFNSKRYKVRKKINDYLTTARLLTEPGAATAIKKNHYFTVIPNTPIDKTAKEYTAIMDAMPEGVFFVTSARRGNPASGATAAGVSADQVAYLENEFFPGLRLGSESEIAKQIEQYVTGEPKAQQFVYGYALDRQRRTNPGADAATRLFEKFHGAKADGKVDLKLPRHLNNINLPTMTLLGRLSELGYITEKGFDDFETANYTHEFEGDAILLAHPASEKGLSLMVIIGDFNIEDVGITG